MELQSALEEAEVRTQEWRRCKGWKKKLRTRLWSLFSSPLSFVHGSTLRA